MQQCLAFDPLELVAGGYAIYMANFFDSVSAVGSLERCCSVQPVELDAAQYKRTVPH